MNLNGSSSTAPFRRWTERIRTPQPKDKNKQCVLHAPEVECIGKGKARKPYKFGVKVSIVVTHKRGLMEKPGRPLPVTPTIAMC
ncbi:hypothetical protein CSQ89_14550 [Chitinimonas sp. BJB300]|nr:hypothetical protein CSQ89_14550 [Chitinimonas sp. BJB300]